MKLTKHKTYSAFISLVTVLLVILVFLASTSTGFVAFALTIALFGVCNYIIGNVENFASSGFATIYIFGALTIGGIVYWKTQSYLLKFVHEWERVVRPDENKKVEKKR